MDSFFSGLPAYGLDGDFFSLEDMKRMCVSSSLVTSRGYMLARYCTLDGK